MVLGVATVISAILLAAVLVSVAVGQAVYLELFLPAILLNAVLLLVYLRKIFRGGEIPADRKDFWSIIVFVLGPFGQLAYLWKVSDRANR